MGMCAAYHVRVLVLSITNRPKSWTPGSSLLSDGKKGRQGGKATWNRWDESFFRKYTTPSTGDSPRFHSYPIVLDSSCRFLFPSPIRIYVRSAVGTVTTVIGTLLFLLLTPYMQALFLSSSTSMATLIQNYLCFFKPQHSSPASALLQL
jgi:hypothetical protein